MVSKSIHLNTACKNGKPCYIAYNTGPDYRDYGDANPFLKVADELAETMKAVIDGFSCKFKSRRPGVGLQVVEVYGSHAAENCECLARLVAAKMDGKVVTA